MKNKMNLNRVLKGLQKSVTTVLMAQMVLLPLASQKANADLDFVAKAKTGGMSRAVRMEKLGWRFFNSMMTPISAKDMVGTSITDLYMSPPIVAGDASQLLIHSQTKATGSVIKTYLHAHVYEANGALSASIADGKFVAKPDASDLDNKKDWERSIQLFEYQVGQKLKIQTKKSETTAMTKIINFLFPSAEAKTPGWLRGAIYTSIGLAVVCGIGAYFASVGFETPQMRINIRRWLGAAVGAILLVYIFSMIDSNMSDV